MTILELREKRAKAWEAAKAFLDSHRNDKGVLSAEDDAAYTRMEQEITDLGKEIARLERQEALEAELNRPVNKPLTGKPMSGKEETKTGRATDEYRTNFWNMMRSKAPMPSVVNALQIGTDSEGGYLVPDEYERTLVEALEEENVFRQLAKVIQTSSGDRKIPVVATKGTAAWIDEEGAYTESDDSFGQVSIGAYKLGTMIKVSEELLNDSVFDLESYISREFARRIGAKEEEAFFTGDGSGKPLGILAASGGAETGITAASATAITADELIDLFYSLNREEEGELVNYLVRNEKQNKSYAYDKEVPGSKKAILHYRLIGRSQNYYLLEIDLKTGRHHQIRCQLAKMGCPIKGDLKYGSPRSNPDGSICLHARYIRFVHPVSKELIEVEAPVPPGNLWNGFETI